MTRPKIVVTLPAYRAERTLGKTVAAIPEGAADHLILVDDASPDHTAEIARGLGIDVIVHPTNRGYGGNQKTCYVNALAAGADVVVLLHPDYQYDPGAVPLLTASILAGDADMTFGSRFAGLGDPMGGGMPLYRYVGNRVSTTVENLVLGSRFTEMHSGMRAYTRRCLLSLPFLSYSDNFAFDAQFLVDAVTLGLRVVEVPIPTRYTEESSSIGVGRSFRYVGTGLRYCVEQTARRGRRGRKSPVASRAVDEGPLVIATGIAPTADVAQWIVESIGGYRLRGKRLATGIDVVATEADRAGWTTGVLAAGDEADAMVVATDTEALAPAALARVRSAIDDEGLVAFWTPSNEPRLSGYLRAHGFRVVGWDPAPRGSAVLVTARPA